MFYIFILLVITPSQALVFSSCRFISSNHRRCRLLHRKYQVSPASASAAHLSVLFSLTQTKCVQYPTHREELRFRPVFLLLSKKPPSLCGSGPLLLYCSLFSDEGFVTHLQLSPNMSLRKLSEYPVCVWVHFVLLIKRHVSVWLTRTDCHAVLKCFGDDTQDTQLTARYALHYKYILMTLWLNFVKLS